MTREQCLENNLIAALHKGYYQPFVAIRHGIIYIGDRDRIESFNTPKEAYYYLTQYILLAFEHKNHDATEYKWHYDAELQLHTLKMLEHRLRQEQQREVNL